MPPTSQSAFTLTAGGVAILAATLLVEAGGFALARFALGGEELLLLLRVGAVAVGLSLPLWLVAVGELGLVPSAIHQNLGPFYVVALGLVLGQGLAPARAAAAALVVAGALLAQLAPGRRVETA